MTELPDGNGREDRRTIDNDNSGRPSGKNEGISGAGQGAFSFNGRVVLGVGIILAIAAASSIFAASISQSSQIHLSSSNPFAFMTMSASAQKVDKPATRQQQSDTNGDVDKKFVLVANDFGWNGTANGPTIQVNKGDSVQITFINAGQMAHNFGIAKLSKETTDLLNKTHDMSLEARMNYIPYDAMAMMPCPGCEKKFEKGHIETFILPDQQKTTTFTVDEAGQFNYFCMVRGHIWLGMIGNLIVLDQPSTSTIPTAAISGGGQESP